MIIMNPKEPNNLNVLLMYSHSNMSVLTLACAERETRANPYNFKNLINIYFYKDSVKIEVAELSKG